MVNIKQKKIEEIKEYVQDLFNKDSSGHDFYHMQRVANMAKNIALHEGADEFICEVAAWLHDIGDYKLFQNPDVAINELKAFLISLSINEQDMETILHIIRNISYSKGKIPDTIEGKIVQDADRLDAIGAIGIARTFAYGGTKGQMIYHEEQENTSVQHFYDKLLKLKEMMHTEQAKKIAQQRHQFMENFLEQFFQEW
ncbi:HD domain-containing protein [Oceanobacillus halophilus]|uniref:HD domain-containing protein n=1 Tax=Oceanobacillus halophilus TaxID=930130 RepID=A0A495ADD1_9BACI|nr:HD domain-containing protein [Oceanobacillus halophilus]RKQ37620.1 HD domain-containing protein [Oceanobacillus halophilus]